MKTQYVLGFAFQYNRVVLILKSKPAWQRGKLNGVGGKIEAGEDATTAMRREFQEETGVVTSPWNWRKFTKMCFDDVVVHCFVSQLPPLASPHTTTEETIMFENLDSSFFRDSRLIENLRWLIPMALIALNCEKPESHIPSIVDFRRSSPYNETYEQNEKPIGAGNDASGNPS